jgi:hypothetical protein
MHLFLILLLLLLSTTTANNNNNNMDNDNSQQTITIKNKILKHISNQHQIQVQQQNDLPSDEVVITYASDGWWWTLWQGIVSNSIITSTCTPHGQSRTPLAGVKLVNRGTYYLITHTMDTLLFYLCMVSTQAVWYLPTNLPGDGSEKYCRFVFQSTGADKMYKIAIIQGNNDVQKWLRVGNLVDDYWCLINYATLNPSANYCGSNDAYCIFQVRSLAEING